LNGCGPFPFLFLELEHISFQDKSSLIPSLLSSPLFGKEKDLNHFLGQKL
jgi:hypothetical protein